MASKFDPEGTRLPIKIDSTSNGEFEPVPLDKRSRFANRLARERAGDNAKRLGLDRRSFLVSATGAASTLLAFNEANALAGKRGGHYAIASEASVDADAAGAALEGREFIFDVQGHYVNPAGDWIKKMPETARPLAGIASMNPCAGGLGTETRDYLGCIDADSFIIDVFLDSDTDMMVLSFVPSRRDAEPLTIEEAAATQAIVEELEGNHRLMLHGRVNPNQDGDLEGMDELAERWGVAAWKTYTQWGPDGKGFFLSDEDVGIPFIEKARSLGVKVIAIHKGLPFGRRSYEHSRSDDIGVVAKMYPDVDFIVYHSSLDTAVEERAFAPGAGRDGIDSLVQSVIDNGIAPGGNVYAELGSTWRFLMRDPDQAAHGLGKLLKYVGEDNVLWGTDSIWYGSPQDQIQAFRSFQISAEFQEKHGYPEITPEIRAKVFGLNATKPYKIDLKEVKKRASHDGLSRKRANYAEKADPHFRTFGPKTRREFVNLLKLNGGSRL